jgi:hypothetical protein
MDGCDEIKHADIGNPFGIIIEEPDPAENKASAERYYERIGPFNIDQWPESVRALSFPTRMIEVEDKQEFLGIFDPPGDAIAQRYADRLDVMMGWDSHFIRLNSRSPKDTSYPVAPITASGKQAMWWIRGSERCLEDAVRHYHANKPLFICAREWRPINPAFEFRCFAKDGQLIAVSRYDYANPSQVNDAEGSWIFAAVEDYYRNNLSAHFSSVVFDLYAPGQREEILIELNPYGLSDPCLFVSYEEVEKGGILVGNKNC